VTHYFHAFGQWNMSVDDHGAANAAAALVAFNEVMTWAVENDTEAEMREMMRKLRSDTLALLRALRVSKNSLPTPYIAEVPLTKVNSRRSGFGE
jgi:hypothetical protein